MFELVCVTGLEPAYSGFQIQTIANFRYTQIEKEMVGTVGFEPTTLCSEKTLVRMCFPKQMRYQTALCPVKNSYLSSSVGDRDGARRQDTFLRDLQYIYHIRSTRIYLTLAPVVYHGLMVSNLYLDIP